MKFVKLLLVVLLSASLLGAKSAPINLNFSNLSINDFIKMVSKITKKNILISAPVNGKIDFISDHGISKEQLFTLLQAVLESKGYTLVEQNGFLTTVRLGDAAKEAPAMKDNDYGQIHTQVIHVESADANTLSSQLRFLLSKLGKLVVSRDNNAFIVTDYPKNTRLIKQLIDKLDQKKEQEISFITLEHVKISSLFTEFQNIINALYDQKIVQQKVDLFKNEGTNTLIMIGKKHQLARLKPLLAKLDKPDEITKQTLKLIPLKNADVTETAALLNDIITKKTYPKDTIKPTVSADKQLNALMLIATPEEIREFQALILELDQERQQVYVKARVMEISKNKTDKLGMKYGFGAAAISKDSDKYGPLVANTLYTLTSNLGGAIPDAATVQGAGGNKALSANVNFVLSNGAGKTLSEPSVLCINNEESSIYVGKTQSISSGTTNNAISGTIQNFTREDIGLTLKIKPRIANDNKVTLNIETTMEDIDQSVDSSEGRPTTTKREVKTTAIVRDGESVLIGGLIREYKSKSVSKIPLLGDIPLFGWLFRSEDMIVDDINLVVVLTPYIIQQSSDLGKLRKRLAKLKAVEDAFNKITMHNLEKRLEELNEKKLDASQ